MKKTYIKPENTVVCINVETMIATSPGTDQMFSANKAVVNEGVVEIEAREVVQTPDAWEEW